MTDIPENRLYTKADLVRAIGLAAFNAAQNAGLFAVGDRYLGKKVLDALARAHDIKASQRAKSRKGNSHEKKAMAQSIVHPAVQPAPGPSRKADLLGALAQE